MGILEIIGELADLWTSWRFYLCVALSVGGALFIHARFGDEMRVWFISIPLVIVGIGSGLVWEIKAEKK
jgi:hypothetical protein